jgi:hypothetical protein
MLLSSLSCGENNTYQGKYQETKDVEASIDKFCECKIPGRANAYRGYENARFN